VSVRHAYHGCVKRKGARAANELLRMLDEPPEVGKPAPLAERSDDAAPLSEEIPESEPASEFPPSTTRSIPGFVARHRIGFAIGGVATLLVATAIFRYASFDPELYAYNAMSIVTSTSDDALVLRFHPEGRCARYGHTETDDAHDEKVAEAIIAAGLGGYLEPLVRNVGRWEKEADDKHHASPHAVEIITYLGESGGPWARVGLRMHRDEVVQRYRILHERRRLTNVQSVAALPDRLESAALKLWQEHAPINGGAERVATTQRRVDLNSSNIALVTPGMNVDDVLHRLGTPVRLGNDLVFADLSLVVTFDSSASAVRIARGNRGNPMDTIFVGDKHVAHDKTAIVAALGEPLWRAESGGGATLVYKRGEHRMKLDFALDALTSVELWRTDLLIAPKPESEDTESTKGDGKSM
jgi:hypothetical protein